MVHAAIEGELTEVETVKDEIFGLNIPTKVPGVPRSGAYYQSQTWKDQKAYTEKAEELANKFKENFKKFASVGVEIEKLGGPIA